MNLVNVKSIDSILNPNGGNSFPHDKLIALINMMLRYFNMPQELDIVYIYIAQGTHGSYR